VKENLSRNPDDLLRLRWRVAWVLFFVYLASVVTGLYLAFGPGVMMPREVFFLFAPLFAFLALRGHLTGFAPAWMIDGDRAKDPVSFWMLTSCYWLCAAGCLAVGFGAWLGFWA
jgi:hypothetical protein